MNELTKDLPPEVRERMKPMVEKAKGIAETGDFSGLLRMASEALDRETGDAKKGEPNGDQR